MALEPNIGGFKTNLNISDIAYSGDNSITIESDGNISQTIKNAPEQYYGAPVFGRAFGASATNLFVATDSTYIQTVTMDFVNVDSGAAPTITFEANSLNDKIPNVTLYWMTTTAQQETVFATNSAKSTNSSLNNSLSWGMMWYTSPASSYIYGVDFRPDSKYTEMAIGGNFVDLGPSPKGGVSNSYNGYAIVNLSGGTNIFKPVNAVTTTFGPLGSALSGLTTNQFNYYGGYSGIRLGTGEYLITTKYIDISSTDGPQPGGGRARRYLCLAGKFTSLTYSNSTIKTNGLFIIDRDNPKTHFCRFEFANANIYSLEYDPDYQSLLIGGQFTGSARILSGLSSANLASSYIRTNTWEASSGSINGIARLYLTKRDTEQTLSSCPLWDRFHFDTKFNAQAGSQIQSAASYPILNLSYRKNVLYASGNLITTTTVVNPAVAGVAAFYCGEGRYGFDDGPYGGGATKHASLGLHVAKLNSGIFPDLYLRWPTAINFIKGGTSGYNNVYDLKIRDQKKDGVGATFLYVAGYFTYTDQNGNISYYQGTTKAAYVAAFDITESLNGNGKPILMEKWKPLPNNIVSSIETGFDGECDDGVVYLLGRFTSITTKGGINNRRGCAAVTSPSENIDASVLNWLSTLNYLTSTTQLFSSKMWNIPSISPVSGLLIHNWNTGKVNNVPVNNLFRVTRYGQNIAPYLQQAVEWQMSSKILDGSDLAFPSSSFLKVSSLAGSEYNVNTTTIDSETLALSTDGSLDSIQAGSLLRFLIKRPGRTLVQSTSSQYYNGRVWFLGAKIDQNP
jgi:hypothetical protein